MAEMSMGLPAARADLRTLASGATIRRAIAIAGVAFFERMLTPVIALTLVQRGLRDKVAVTLLFGAVFTARSLLQRVLLARNEGDLLERTAASVLDGEVLSAGILPDQDVSVQAAQGVHVASRLLTLTLPNLCADLLACCCLGVGVALLEPPRLAVLAAAVTVAAAAALFVSRRVVARTVDVARREQERVYDAFTQVLDGRLEIVASGRRRAFMDHVREAASTWSAAGARIAGATVLTGRLTLVAVAAVVAGAVLASARLRGSLEATGADLALFASVTPAFVGVAQGVHGLAVDARWTHLLARVLRRGVLAPTGGMRSPPPLPAPAVFDAVSFRYGDPAIGGEALSAVAFGWTGREILGLSGPNGSGKSTCLRMLLRLAKPSAGAIRVSDVSLADLEADGWRARVAFLPQRPYLAPRADVRSAVSWPLSGVRDQQIIEAVDLVGLLDILRRAGADPLAVRVDSLSIGERQRVALARLLCRDASLFLLDEPDANLDRAGVVLVAELLRLLARRGMVAFAAHTPELLAVADRVVVLARGRVQTVGELDRPG
jgi:ABC-type transport system involved in cytochrome bd biosynthesis fused ATPase/permease subunit